RNGLTLKTSHLAIRQDGLQPIAHFNPGAMVPDGIQDQNSAITSLIADPPFMEQINGVALDVGAVERIDGEQRDLHVSLLINLQTDIFYLGSSARLEHMCEVLDVDSRVELTHPLRLQNP